MTTRIIPLDIIESILPGLDLTKLIREGFIAYSRGEVVVPPVGEILFENPPGETHIKYGYIKNDDFFVIKIASGFYENSKLGISSSQGLMLVFSQKTGQIQGVLLDEGNLTDIRTAVAGLVAAQSLAPEKIEGIGIIGTGIQARLQLKYLLENFQNRNIWITGRTSENVKAFIQEFEQKGFKIQSGTSTEISRNCNLIVTTTTATTPVLEASDVLPGTHITAVGSDTPSKNELDIKIFQKAEVIVADSISQCITRGEIHHALDEKVINKNQILELGNILSGKIVGRATQDQISIADLTGVAVQDIQIAKAVYSHYLNN